MKVLDKQGLAGVVATGLLLPKPHTDCNSLYIKNTEQANNPDYPHQTSVGYFSLPAVRYWQKGLTGTSSQWHKCCFSCSLLIIKSYWGLEKAICVKPANSGTKKEHVCSTVWQQPAASNPRALVYRKLIINKMPWGPKSILLCHSGSRL